MEFPWRLPNYNITARTTSRRLTPSAGNVAVGVSGVAANYLAGDKFTNTGAVSLAVTYTVVPVSAAGFWRPSSSHRG